MGKRIDLTGQRFGRLVVESFAYADKDRHSMWNCKCDCGSKIVAKGSNLRGGRTQSCGCLHREIVTEQSRKHGKTNTRLHSIWQNMIDRTERKSNRQYKDYGGRGITVCKEWRDDFEAFYEWAMNHGYKDNLTIDRINNDRGYSPDNCRWSTRKQQGRNRRSNHLISYNGEIKTLTEWAEQLQVSCDLLRDRLKCGWTVEEALETPVGEPRKQ